MPAASLIMTVFNRANTLGEAIESALAQTVTDFDLIVWDDGSTDGSVEIAAGYAAADDRVRAIQADHLGRAGALIAAIAKSDAPYFGILDSDDRLAPRALEATLPVIGEDPDISIVYTDHRDIDDAGRDLGRGARCAIPYSPDKVLLNQMVFHFRLFSREIYDEVGGFDPAFDCAQDYDLVLRMSEVGHVRHVPEILYDYRRHGESISIAKYREQLDMSRRAIDKALARRGVGDKLAAHVDASGGFHLIEKEQASDDGP